MTDRYTASCASAPTGPSSTTEKRPPFFRLLCVTALFAVGGWAATVATVVYLALDRDAQLYRSTDGGWQPLADELPGTPNLLLSADGGALWVRTMFRGSIARYADGRWQVFRGEEFRTAGNYPQAGFALSGNACWTVLDEILLKWNSDDWEHVSLLPMDPSKDRPLAMAVDSEGLWILGSHAVLWRYENDQWENEDLARQFPGVPERSRIGWTNATIRVSADGALWLTAGNVWRRTRGGAWQQVQAGDMGLYEAVLVGRGPMRMWFAQDEELLWVSLDGEEHGRFALGEMALGQDAVIREVADNGQDVLVATSAGLAVWREGRWTVESLAEPESQLGAVSLTAAGDAWLVAYRRLNPLPTWIVSGTLVGVALLLALLVCRLCGLPKKRWTMTYALAMAGVLMVFIWEFVTNDVDLAPGHNEFTVAVTPLMLCILAVPLPLLLVMLRWFQSHTSEGIERISFQPVAEHELPRRTSQYFARHTDEMESLGFRRLADYRLKRRTPFFVRAFISSDGTTYGEISTQRALWLVEIRVCGFVSMFDNGHYLETGNVSGKSQDQGMFHMQTVGRRRLADVWAAHQEKSAAICEQYDTLSVPLESDDYPIVSTYGQKLLYDCMVREGLVSENPYRDVAAPRLPEAAVV